MALRGSISGPTEGVVGPLPAAESPVPPGGTTGQPLIKVSSTDFDTEWATLPVIGGGTGAIALTDHGIVLGQGTNPVGVTAAMTDGQLLIGQTGADPAPETVTGDVTITNGGVTAIGANKVQDSQIRQSAGLSVIGRSASTTGNVADITATAYQILRADSTASSINFGSIDLSQSAAVGSSLLGATNGGTGINTYTLGDIIYSNASNSLTVLPGNTTTTKKFLNQTGDGVNSGAPSWGAGVALSTVDDTNITIVAGGSPTDALLSAVSLTMGWTGTLAAGRLNSNVVQGITNDTNVTGSIAAQNLTLGWTGTLAAGRLNSNVVQAVTNDTNITGSISAQNLTFAWAGTLANSRLADMADSTIKGRAVGAGTGSPTDLTGTQATAILNAFVGDSGSGGTKGLVPAPAAGDSSKVLRGDGTWSATAGAGTVTQVSTSGGISGGPITTSGTVQLAQSRPGGRLTLVTGTPVLNSDQVGATSIYYTPYQTDLIPIYDGSSTWTTYAFTELGVSLASSANWASGSVYDWFVVNDSGTLRLVSGPAWSTTTARGTGAGTTEIVMQNGLWLNANSMTGRYGASSTLTAAAKTATYIGTSYMTANGQTGMAFKPAAAAGGTANVLGVWNAYNMVNFTSLSRDSTDTWTYSTAAWRSANGNTANRVTFIKGLTGYSIRSEYLAIAQAGASSQLAESGVGYDSTSSISGGTPGVSVSAAASQITPITSIFQGFAGLGLHFVQALEYGPGSGTMTWLGDGGDPTANQMGLWLATEM